MKPPTPAPNTIEELRQVIVERCDHLSKRLQLNARHALHQPDDFALQTLAVISKRSGAQPSAIVRFSSSTAAIWPCRVSPRPWGAGTAKLLVVEHPWQIVNAAHIEVTK